MTITAEQAQALKAGITPGPWEIDRENSVCNQINGTFDAICTDQFCCSPEREVNARAIAAVPDLLDTIIEQVAEIERLSHMLDLSQKTTDAVLERAEKAESERDEAIARRDAKMKAAGMREAAMVRVSADWIGMCPMPERWRNAILASAEEIEKEALK